MIDSELREFTKREVTQHASTCAVAAEVRELRALIATHTERINELIEVLHMMNAVKGAIRFFDAVERIAVFLAKFVGAVGILWATWKFLIKEALAQAASKLH